MVHQSGSSNIQEMRTKPSFAHHQCRYEPNHKKRSTNCRVTKESPNYRVRFDTQKIRAPGRPDCLNASRVPASRLLAPSFQLPKLFPEGKPPLLQQDIHAHRILILDFGSQ